MKYSCKLSDAVHILVLIATNPLENLSSAAMAESIHTHSAFVRQIMSSLRKAGLIVSVRGHATPSLAMDASEISLLDIYRAVEGEKPLLHLDTHTNPECGAGVNIQYSLQDYYDEIQMTAEKKMAEIRLEDIIRSFYIRLEKNPQHAFMKQTYTCIEDI